jgi:hypothetical protein
MHRPDSAGNPRAGSYTIIPEFFISDRFLLTAAKCGSDRKPGSCRSTRPWRFPPSRECSPHHSHPRATNWQRPVLPVHASQYARPSPLRWRDGAGAGWDQGKEVAYLLLGAARLLPRPDHQPGVGTASFPDRARAKLCLSVTYLGLAKWLCSGDGLASPTRPNGSKGVLAGGRRDRAGQDALIGENRLRPGAVDVVGLKAGAQLTAPREESPPRRIRVGDRCL